MKHNEYILIENLVVYDSLAKTSELTVRLVALIKTVGRRMGLKISRLLIDMDSRDNIMLTSAFSNPFSLLDTQIVTILGVPIDFIEFQHIPELPIGKNIAGIAVDDTSKKGFYFTL